jgi:hypothetical protein
MCDQEEIPICSCLQVFLPTWVAQLFANFFLLKLFYTIRFFFLKVFCPVVMLICFCSNYFAPSEFFCPIFFCIVFITMEGYSQDGEFSQSQGQAWSQNSPWMSYSQPQFQPISPQMHVSNFDRFGAGGPRYFMPLGMPRCNGSDLQPSSEEMTPSSNAKNFLMDVKEEEEVYTRYTRVLTNIMGLPATFYVVLIVLGLKGGPSGCFFDILKLFSLSYACI